MNGSSLRGVACALIVASCISSVCVDAVQQSARAAEQVAFAKKHGKHGKHGHHRRLDSKEPSSEHDKAAPIKESRKLRRIARRLRRKQQGEVVQNLAAQMDAVPEVNIADVPVEAPATVKPGLLQTAWESGLHEDVAGVADESLRVAAHNAADDTKIQAKFTLKKKGKQGVKIIGKIGKKQRRKDSDQDRIHVTMLSDRTTGAAAGMESVCRNAAQPSRLRFHIIGPGEQWSLQDLAPSCFSGGAMINVYPLQEMISRVVKVGFSPIWQWNQTAFNGSAFTVQTAEWDNSSTHKDPFNLLRFYLPYIMPFRKLSKVLFMDDDVIILKDVAKAWDYEIKWPNVMSASCQNWVWGDCDRFESGTKYSYLDVPYFGYGRINSQRTISDAICQNTSQRECMPRGFMQLLGKVSEVINGKKNAITKQKLGNSTAWNYGFNLFNLDAWREHNITDKYVQWMKLNNRFRLFPETSLAYGLGIAMLAKIGRVQCFDEDTPVVQGLGFVGPGDMRAAGLNLDALKNSFGLHFNGPHKPWEPEKGNPYYNLFLDYAQPAVRENFMQSLGTQQALRAAKTATKSTSFVLLTDPRSGSEWFMEMLDNHAEICASGESEDGAVGYPREAMLPSRYVKDRELLNTNAEYFSMLDLGMHSVVSQKTEVPRNYYTGSGPVSGRAQELMTMNSSAHWAWQLPIRAGPHSCQAKAGCAWGNIASLVWRASGDRKLCAGSSADWVQRSQKLGFAEHLRTVCSLLQRAEARLSERGATIEPRGLVAESFQAYFRHQMSTVDLSGVAYGSDEESNGLLPCKCPQKTLVYGQKLMHDWLGDLPEKGMVFSRWRDRPWDVNFNAANASSKLNAPYYDLVGAMQEVGTKVILFHRDNLLARFVSLTIANKSNVFHCEDEKCAKTQAKERINLDVARFRGFVKWTRQMHQRTQAWLEGAGIGVINLKYEDCVDDVKTCLDSVTSFLGVPPHSEEKLSGQQIKIVDDLPSKIENIQEVRAALVDDGWESWLN